MNRVLAAFPVVRFLVGGAGDEQSRIEAVAEKWNTQCGTTRVLMLGEIPHDQVAPFLVLLLLLSHR